MMSAKNRAIPIIIGVVAAAVFGVVVTMKSRGGSKEADDDEAFSAVKPSAPKKVERKEKPASAAEPTPAVGNASAKTVPAKVTPTPIADNDDDLLNAALDEVAQKSAPVSTSTNAPSNIVAKPTTFSGERTELEHLGISVKVPKGWEVREELSPVPNVAMVTVWNPDFASMPNAEVPGAVPVIILSVEDIHGENLSLNEFKERSKELSMQQMLMMTGGVIQPVVRKDTSIQEGAFRQYLEYVQSMPPYFDIAVINLIEVRNGVAYVFQIMANPKIMNDFKSTFMQIARDINVTPMESSSLGYLDVKTGVADINIDTTWNWSYPNEGETGADPSAPIATFELTSSVKKEKISLYSNEKVPTSNHNPRETKTTEGVEIVSAFDGTAERKVFSYNGYSLVVEPQQKAISFLPEGIVVKAIKSVSACSDTPKPKMGATFVTKEYGYMFDVVGGGRVVSTKLGKGTVVYAPLGVPQDPTKEMSPEAQGPTVTIRVGNPKDDPDCMSTIEEWSSRIHTESASSDISGIKVIDLKGEKCLTFKSKEMQETAPGEKTEICGDVYIFVRNGITTLIRWECARGQSRKFERDLKIFLESFEFVE